MCKSFEGGTLFSASSRHVFQAQFKKDYLTDMGTIGILCFKDSDCTRCPKLFFTMFVSGKTF